ncbi:MAG TPA: hypothetical protein VI874_02150, partial [Candidatus Norongarragalinales archaeon]|nr:hypothetical protein [Candidatus Norongarragalinales archaeon]
MRQTTFFLFSLIFLSSFAFALSIPKETFTIQATATAPQISLFVAKTSYNQNESMEIFGSLYQVTATSGVASAFSPLTSKNVTVWLTNSSGNSQQYNFTTDVNGSFYSNSSLNPSSTVVRAPMAVGPYTLTAQYNTSISLVNSSVTFQVANQTVDALLIQPNKAEYSVGENVTVTFTALRGTGLQEVRVANFSVNATLRYRNETILSSRACTTGSNGTCVSTFSAPSSVSAQSFLIEANGFFGFALFNVATFSVSALVMDSNGKELKDVFSSGDSGTLSVRVSINGSVPASGNFTVSASLGYANGTRLSSLSSVFLETNNSFTN